MMWKGMRSMPAISFRRRFRRTWRGSWRGFSGGLADWLHRLHHEGTLLRLDTAAGEGLSTTFRARVRALCQRPEA